MMKVTIITSFASADPICVLSYHSTSFHSFLSGSDSSLSYTIYPENESCNSFHSKYFQFDEFLMKLDSKEMKVEEDSKNQNRKKCEKMTDIENTKHFSLYLVIG